MKFITLLICLVTANVTLGQKIEDFLWLEGTWKRKNLKQGSTAYESWVVSSNSMIGLGVRLKEADTVFVEKLRIIETENGVSYVAEVDHNASPVHFRITDFTQDSFVSENPDHDFPKKIVYKLIDKELIVTISGDGNSIPFVFQKTD